jgi:formate hydrogenlyase subunit 6/NADH:ubiquinone oxidoreductase subunit I
MVTQAFYELLKQFFNDPVTNLFPVKEHPGNVHGTLRKVEQGRVKLNPPVEVPPGFRGKILYDREACIGCQMCIKVCPSATIEFIPEGKKVKFYMARCTFCALCNDICPKKCIKMSDTFIMANTDKYGKDMIVIDSGRFVVTEKKVASVPEKAPAPGKAPDGKVGGLVEKAKT